MHRIEQDALKNGLLHKICVKEAFIKREVLKASANSLKKTEITASMELLSEVLHGSMRRLRYQGASSLHSIATPCQGH